MKDATPHILKLVNQVVTDVRAKAEKMEKKPTKEMQDEFWTDTLYCSTILLRCLNNAFFHDKPISKIYRLDNSSLSVYGVPIPSKDVDRDFDFLVLDGNETLSNGDVIQIQKSDHVNLWHTFRSVS